MPVNDHAYGGQSEVELIKTESDSLKFSGYINANQYNKMDKSPHSGFFLNVKFN